MYFSGVLVVCALLFIYFYVGLWGENGAVKGNLCIQTYINIYIIHTLLLGLYWPPINIQILLNKIIHVYFALIYRAVH